MSPRIPFFLTVSKRSFWTRREASQDSCDRSCLRLSSVRARICTRTEKGEPVTIFHLRNDSTEIPRDQGPPSWLVLIPAEAGIIGPGVRAPDGGSPPGKHNLPSPFLLSLLGFRRQDRPRRYFFASMGPDSQAGPDTVVLLRSHGQAVGSQSQFTLSPS